METCYGVEPMSFGKIVGKQFQKQNYTGEIAVAPSLQVTVVFLLVILHLIISRWKNPLTDLRFYFIRIFPPGIINTHSEIRQYFFYTDIFFLCVCVCAKELVT